MMKYTVRHACGHEQVHDIYGPNSRGQHQRTAARYAGQDCSACRSRAHENAQEQAALQAATAAGVTMPDLTGTPKQVTWAESLRERALAKLLDQPAAVRAAATQSAASWWIDHRDDLPGALAALQQSEPEDDPHQPAGMDQWERLERMRDVYDAAPQIRTEQQARVAQMLAVALRPLVCADHPADRDPLRRAELTGTAKALRRVLIEQLNVRIGVPLNQPLGVPEGTDWRTLTREQREKSEYLWLQRELARYDAYVSHEDPVAQLQRAWMDWNLADHAAGQALDTLASIAARVNASGAPKRLSLQQIADAVPADRKRSWAQWLVNRGRRIEE